MLIYSKDVKENFNMLGTKLSCFLSNLKSWEKDEYFQIPTLVKYKAYILLSGLILKFDFNWPFAINPTLRNSVQFEWEILDKNHINWYFEIEVFEEKTSLLLAWRKVNFNVKDNSEEDSENEEPFSEPNTFTFTFDEREEKFKDFPFTIFNLLTLAKARKDKNILNILEKFTKKVERGEKNNG